MKKFRIIFAVMTLVAIFAAPAYADFFYLRKDTDTTEKVAPLLYPLIGMFDYPKDLTLNSTDDAPAFCGTFSLPGTESDVQYMYASNWDATENAQVGSLFVYQGFGWGMPSSDTNPYRIDSIVLPGSGKNPSDIISLGTLLYLTDRGAQGSAGSLTVHNANSETELFEKVGSVTFTPNDPDQVFFWNYDYWDKNDIYHADSVFTYNNIVYVLLSVENNGKWKPNILATVTYAGGECKVTNALTLNTTANGYATLVPYLDTSGYMLLACGNIIEKVTLGDAPSTQILVDQGIDMPEWEGHFSHIARDNNDNTYIMCKSAEAAEATTLVYKVSSTALDAMAQAETKIIAGTPIYNISNQEGYPFIAYDLYYNSVVWIYLGEQNTMYRYEGGSLQGTTGLTIGGDGYIREEPILSYVMNNPSDTQIPDNSGGCNAGATAVMLAFCALPLFFRKKH